jgi:oxygen-independent coproporphyrinogen III oxidase
MQERSGLYIHVPFCESKCNYCDFYSVAPATLPEREDYLRALAIELAGLPDDFEPDTVYIGGGTPTVLDPDMLVQLLDEIAGRLEIDQIQEYTIEANPGTLTAEKLELLLAAGIDRISLGAQSFDDDVLAFLGRAHSAVDTLQAVEAIRSVGIPNLSMDIIFGIPGTDAETVQLDVARAIALAPEHISSYALNIAAGTRLHFLREQGDISELDDDLVARQFQIVRDELRRDGYEHYEISNYARPGRHSLHNMLYWSGAEYIGCGPAAHSHWKGVRYSNIANLWEYAQSQFAGRSAHEHSEKLPPEQKARETLVMWLRRLDGVDIAEFKLATGYSPFELCANQIDQLCADGLLELRDGVLALSENAVFISDTVFRELV